MKDEFKMIINKIDNKTKLKKDKLNFYTYDFKLLENYLINLNDKDFIINNLDIILNYSDEDIITYLCNYFKDNKNFQKQFVKNLNNFRFKTYLDLVWDMFKTTFKSKEEYNAFLTEKLFNDLTKEYLDLRFYNYLYDEIKDKNKKEMYLTICLNNNIDISSFNITDSDSFIIKKNIDKIYDNSTNVFFLKKILINNNLMSELKYINNKIDNNIDILIESIINDLGFVKEENKKDIFELLKLITIDICNNENCKYSDIKQIGDGYYNKCYKINNKILKIGKVRETINIIDNPYIIKPLLRKKYKDIFLEVSERALNDITISNTQMYKIYKELRNYGIIWTDVEKENFGKLLKDNNIYWKQNLMYNPKNSSIKTNTNPKKTLKRGDYVILDNDYLYNENNKDISFPSTISKVFEIKFLRELLEVINYIKDNRMNLQAEKTKDFIKSKGFDYNYIIKKINNDTFNNDEMYSLRRGKILGYNKIRNLK